MQFISDFLVIGSGIAGLSYALKAAEFGTVHIITKKNSAESNTNYAQGGIAAVFDQNDSFENHIQDTLISGAGLCNQEAVDVLVKEGPERVKELIEFGVNFTRKNGKVELVKEGGHSHSRILHAQDLTGREIERALLTSAQNHKNITIFEHRQAIDLITQHHIKDKIFYDEPITCYGAYVLDVNSGKIDSFSSKVTFLCTGGVGQVYLHTTNPSIATGDGIAMAYLAGSRVANLEFMQFHPTAFYHPEGKRFLISEAVRGMGGILLNKKSERFMEKYDPRLELATRDIVARAIDSEIKISGEDHVYLSLTHLDPQKVIEHFPNIYKTCLGFGIDILKDPIPVVPAAHYMCGGVVVDLLGQSDIQNLFVGGENACTGVHGANRLASNSLLEALVWSNRSVLAVQDKIKDMKLYSHLIPEWDDDNTSNTEEWVLVSHDFKEIRQIMWDYVGIVRSNLRLQRAAKRIKFISKEIEEFYKRTKLTPEIIELRNISIVAQLIIQCALQRQESRGLHYNTDMPEKDENSETHDTILRAFDRNIVFSKRV